MFFLLQARELQTLHNLRKLFVQDLTTRVKKVKLCSFKPKSSPFFFSILVICWKPLVRAVTKWDHVFFSSSENQD